MKYALKAGILDKPIDLAQLIDRRFIPELIRRRRSI